MKSIEFIEGLRSVVIESNFQIYQDLFNNTRSEDTKDRYLINALKLFNALTADQKKVLFTIIRQIEVDTVSNILAILDGTTSLGNYQPGDIKLTFNNSNHPLQGNLQDIFLELENG
jgi:hypothetical protein